jgi:hypothetical protein
MRDATEYWDMEPGTRLDIGTTAIEYVGEFNWVELPEDSTPDDPLAGWVIDLPNGHSIHMAESEWVGGRDVSSEWHAITFDTMNSGYLIRMTNDEEGAYVARHWGK